MDLDEILESLDKKEIKTHPKEKKISVFDYIAQIDNKTNKLEFDKKLCPAFMLMMHYSHSNVFIHDVNKINKQYFSSLDPELIYKYFYYKIPKGRHYIKWVKKDKEKNDKVEELMEKYDISYREALESVLS